MFKKYDQQMLKNHLKYFYVQALVWAKWLSQSLKFWISLYYNEYLLMKF